jgi:glucose/arabinose dehydrogenase
MSKKTLSVLLVIGAALAEAAALPPVGPGTLDATGEGSASAREGAGGRSISSEKGLRLDSVRLPPGFRVGVFARAEGARSLALGAKGTVFVGTRGEGKVYALVDSDRDGHADRLTVIADGLHSPNGVAFRDGALYVAEISRVVRLDGIEDRLDDPPVPTVVSDRFPPDEHHGWKFIAFGPDGLLYVPIGAPCNVCDAGDPYASITRLNVETGALEIFARGVRNTVGFDWDPGSKDLWFTDNGRDWLGDDVPPDELDRAPGPGMNFGFPFCYGAGIDDPAFPGRDCGAFTPPVVELGAHVAALGMRFGAGEMFPAAYRHSIFIAEHGSWNRTAPVGYRIVRVPVDGETAGEPEVFADGWLLDGKPWGRPVDVQFLGDGSMLVSDDMSGAVYRIAYAPTAGR